MNRYIYRRPWYGGRARRGAVHGGRGRRVQDVVGEAARGRGGGRRGAVSLRHGSIVHSYRRVHPCMHPHVYYLCGLHSNAVAPRTSITVFVQRLVLYDE